MQFRHGRTVVALIGGATIHDLSHPQKFRTQRLDERQYGLIGDELRGHATVVLYNLDQASTTVAVSGGVMPIHKEMPAAPHLSTVVKRELIELGIPGEAIEERDIDPAAGTYQQLLDLCKLVEGASRLDKLWIVSNDWQMPRIKAMIHFRDELSLLRSERPLVRYVCAEGILVDHDPARWHKPIVAAYSSAAMRETLQRELNGAKMVADGTYKFPTTAPNR